MLLRYTLDLFRPIKILVLSDFSLGPLQIDGRDAII